MVIEWYHSTDRVSVSYSNFFLKLSVSTSKNAVTLKNSVRGHSRSLKMTPFDVPSIITYCRSLAATDLSLVVFWHLISTTPRPWNPVQGSLKVIKTGTIQQIGYCFLLVFYRNFVPRTHRFWSCNLRNYRDIETGIRGHWRSLKMTLFDTPPSYWCSI